MDKKDQEGAEAEGGSSKESENAHREAHETDCVPDHLALEPAGPVDQVQDHQVPDKEGGEGG